VIDPAAALRAGVGALLTARGQRDLSAIVARSGLELVGPEEQWAMGARTVTARRAALIVSAADYARLTAAPSEVEALRSACAAAMRTPETELADLAIVLRLEPEFVAWHHAYRHTPVKSAPDRPSDDAIKGGAVALAEAEGEKEAALALSRARIESGLAGGVRRLIARLPAADYARALRDPALGERIRRCVRAAATSAFEEGGLSVDLAVAAVEAQRPGLWSPAASVLSALAKRGIAAMVVTEEPGRVEIAAAVGGELRILEISAEGRAAVFKREKAVPMIRVTASAIADEGGLSDLCAMIAGPDPL
jgi:hypothetical protein